jgi:hypothetical protein
METITLDTAVSKLHELSKLIEALKAQAATPTQYLHIPEVSIELQPGERYAGPVLDTDGHLLHHLVLLPHKPDESMSWQAAMDWVASVDGDLPTRQEQALLFANCKQQFERARHWSCEQHESDASYAWSCYFFHGHQGDFRKSYEACARAVRRFNPSVL